MNQAVHDPKVSARNAILIAPWAVVPIVALSIEGGAHLSRFELFAAGILLATLFAVPLAYLAVLIVGYPAYRLLAAAGALNGWSLCAVGALTGALGGWVFVGPEGIVLCATSAFAVAFTAWLILRRTHLKPEFSDANG